MKPVDRVDDVEPATHPATLSTPVSNGPARADRTLLQLARGLAIWTAVVVLVSVILSASSGQSWREIVDQHTLIAAIIAIAFTVVGAVVVTQRARHALAWVFIAIGQSEGLACFASAYSVRRPQLPGAGFANWLGDVIWLPGMAMAAGLVTTLFPDGRPYSPRWRFLVRVAVGAVAVVVLLLPFAQPTDPGVPINPLAPGAPIEQFLTQVEFGAVGICLLCGVVGAALLAHRMFAESGVERRRIAWFWFAFFVVVVCQLLPVGVIVPTVATALFPVALGVAMLRYGLFDGDRLLNRTLVYTVLTAVVAGTFGLIAGLTSSAVGGATTAAIIAAVAVALGLSPTRAAIQRLVDRTLYGRTRDPYAAITELGAQLAAVIAPDDLLPKVTRMVAGTFRLPFCAITFSDATSPVASWGNRTETRFDLPLQHAGANVGTLTVGLRDGRRFLDPTDEALLRGFAQQVAVAAAGVRLTYDLRRSRDDLAVAREEERHRIRRDLHDGLGPTLAGVALGIGAAQRNSTPETSELLARLQQEISGSLEDVKQLIADLRPSTLTELGLLPALSRYAETVALRSQGTLSVTVEAGEPFFALPVDTEVAVYRIVLEAVTNVTRHAQASSCQVRLAKSDGRLLLSVTDDGVGLPSTPSDGGLGLRSMSERAAELGGTCEIGPADGAGTRVRVLIPVPGSPPPPSSDPE